MAERGVDLLLLPPYSPDFSPVKQAWSKLKTALRTAQARSWDALQNVLRPAVDWISRADAQYGFDHCGYPVQPAA